MKTENEKTQNEMRAEQLYESMRAFRTEARRYLAAGFKDTEDIIGLMENGITATLATDYALAGFSGNKEAMMQLRKGGVSSLEAVLFAEHGLSGDCEGMIAIEADDRNLFSQQYLKRYQFKEMLMRLVNAAYCQYEEVYFKDMIVGNIRMMKENFEESKAAKNLEQVRKLKAHEFPARIVYAFRNYVGERLERLIEPFSSLAEHTRAHIKACAGREALYFFQAAQDKAFYEAFVIFRDQGEEAFEAHYKINEQISKMTKKDEQPEEGKSELPEERSVS